ncbi:MAG: polysaccharide biosynthesis protein [Thermoleophilaceae bacterium]|nr:polysaccharide biosynthesis protein [Thermoleophilaceae bacterium]
MPGARLTRRMRRSVMLHRTQQILTDAALVSLAFFGAFWLVFNSSIPARYGIDGVPPRYEDLFWTVLPFAVVGKVAVFALFGSYSKWWRYTDSHDFRRLVQAVVLSSLLLVGGVYLVQPGGIALPRSVAAFDFLLTLLLVGGSRFLVRSIVEKPMRGYKLPSGREILIVGAGDGGQMVAREMLRNPELGEAPIGFIDDDPRKTGARMVGLKVLGRTKQLPQILEEAEPDEVIIAIPSAPGSLRESVVSACRERNIPVRTLPTVFELLRGDVNLVKQLREVQVEDILGRDPIIMQLDRMGAYLAGEVVMVTGAGGSIGSELCRQIARVRPRKIILVDHAEDNLFNIRRELEDDRHFGNVEAVLGDCKDVPRMQQIFEEFKPEIVFHAAAYKHVQLMQENPVEAIRNNAIATRSVAELAGQAGVRRFVLVSTDKAVKPKTTMGASKALAEWAIESAQSRHEGTTYCSVRFGNVLGSSGSVVPIFRRQIAGGGPVTVTHPEMTRYFMTIPEAVQLIIRAGDLGHGGEVFVLEMGEPVKIIDLARNMISLAGLEPDVDIPIVVTAPSPGEKLHEDLYNPDETPQPTAAEKIVRAERLAMDPARVEEIFDEVERLMVVGKPQALADLVQAAGGLTSESALPES